MVEIDGDGVEPWSRAARLGEEEDDDDDYDDLGDHGEDEISYEDLKRRMWKDRIRMRKFKEKLSNEPDFESSGVKQEASRRKKMARSQDSILKYMVKIMEVCNAQGFVYGIRRTSPLFSDR